MKSIINSFLKDSRNHNMHTQQRDRIKAQLILLEVEWNRVKCVVYIYSQIQNPQFDSPGTYVIFAQLLKQLSQVLPDAHKSIVRWLRTEYKSKWLKGLIARIQHFISRRQFSQNSSDVPASSKTNWWIPCAVRVMSLISEYMQDDSLLTQMSPI